MQERGDAVGAHQRHSLSICHPDSAPVAVDEDAAAVTKLLFVRLISAAKQSSACLWERKKIKRKSSPWIRPDVDMHASSHVGHVMCSGKVPF